MSKSRATGKSIVTIIASHLAFSGLAYFLGVFFYFSVFPSAAAKLKRWAVYVYAAISIIFIFLSFFPAGLFNCLEKNEIFFVREEYLEYFFSVTFSGENEVDGLEMQQQQEVRLHKGFSSFFVETTGYKYFCIDFFSTGWNSNSNDMGKFLIFLLSRCGGNAYRYFIYAAVAFPFYRMVCICVCS